MNLKQVCLAVLFAMIWPALGSAQERVVIGTAGTAGALYPMGVAMAETINRHTKDISASAESTAGSLANLRNLALGELDWGISSNEVAYQAFHGEGAYKGRSLPTLRSLFGTVYSWAQVFAPADSPISSIKDFRGKKIGVGAPGSAGEQTAQRLLEFNGMSYDDIDEQFMENSEMVQALRDGTIDAFVITHPLKSAPLLDLTSNFKTKLIPIADDGFYKAYPFFTKSVLPGGTYPNNPDDVFTPTTRVVMYTSEEAGLSDDQVYEMLKLIWDNAGEWQDVHAAVKKAVTLKDALVGTAGVPLHPAAARYFSEKGLTIPGQPKAE